MLGHNKQTKQRIVMFGPDCLFFFFLGTGPDCLYSYQTGTLGLSNTTQHINY